jgi:hypothetical protein
MALSAPQQNGDQLNQADVENHTLIVAPTEFIAHIPTVHTKPGEQSPAIRVNVVDLSDPSGAPVKYTGVLWFGIISGSLKRQIGETILGRMHKGTASPGKNPPWQLADIMSEQAWVDYASNWLATEDGQAWEIANIEEINRAAAASAIVGQVHAAAAATQTTAPAPAPVVNRPPYGSGGSPAPRRSPGWCPDIDACYCEPPCWS